MSLLDPAILRHFDFSSSDSSSYDSDSEWSSDEEESSSEDYSTSTFDLMEDQVGAPPPSRTSDLLTMDELLQMRRKLTVTVPSMVTSTMPAKEAPVSSHSAIAGSLLQPEEKDEDAESTTATVDTTGADSTRKDITDGTTTNDEKQVQDSKLPVHREILCPKQVLLNIFESKNLKPKYYSYTDQRSLFVPQQATMYNDLLTRAVKQNNMGTIRTFHQSGASMQTSNKFGESFLNCVVRYQRLDILRYLCTTAGVSVNVHCDTGRTPLHDACWCVNPDFAMIDFLLQQSPQLLFVQDIRGFSPLDYVPTVAYPAWMDFLEKQGHLIMNRIGWY